MVSLSSPCEAQHNPLDVLEELINANDWPFDRASEQELIAEGSGRWCDYHLCFVWQPEVAAVLFSCHFDHRVPQGKRRDVHELLAAVNERLWLGHFDLAKEEGVPMFRHTIPLRGAPVVAVEQLEDVVDTAVVECDSFYPALQLVIWSGQSVADAMQAAMMETVGEA
ncbi:MAG: YbjN domain-containing protein [Kiloniellales bacterium]